MYRERDMSIQYEVISLAERYDLFEVQDEICEKAWPEFMLHDPIANANWMKFIEAYKENQLLIMNDDQILCIANSVPLYYDGTIDDLPDEGWDWGVEKSISDLAAGITPNMILGIQIVVNKNYQGKGLSAIAVKEMAALGREQGYKKLIIPVRPSEKHKYPLIPMEDYIKWQNAESLPFDAWLRVHVRLGGKIIKPCEKAMYIPGTIAEWQAWTGLAFPGSGAYTVPGALCPIIMNQKEDTGIYIEPNVWVLHDLERAPDG